MKVLRNLIVFFVCLSWVSVSMGSEVPTDYSKIQNSSGAFFDIVSISTLDLFNAIPEDIRSDYQAALEDTDTQCSALNGIEFDEARVRYKMVSINEGSQVVGFASLKVIPYSLLDEHGYYQYQGEELAFISIKDALSISDPNTFVFQPGLLHVISGYQNQKLEFEAVYSIFLSYLQDLINESFSGKSNNVSRIL